MNKLKEYIDKLYINIMDIFLNFKMHIRETFWAVIIALSLRATITNIYKIPTGSMIPTINIGDMLLGCHFFYGLKIPFTDGLEGWRLPGFKKPKRGNLIIFRAPPEEYFYILDLKIQSQAGADLLASINEESSSLKRPISVFGGFTNNIFLGANRHKMTAPPRVQATLSVMIHKDICNKRKDIFPHYTRLDTPVQNDLFHIYSGTYQRLHLTYNESSYIGLWKSIIDTPLAGASIIVSILLNSPIYLPTYIYSRIYQYKNRNVFSLITYYEKDYDLSLIRYLDSTKMYVKRVIAEGGDTVQIINKMVFVNGEKIARSSDFEEDRNKAGSVIAHIYEDTMTIRKKDKIKYKKFPVRFKDISRVIYPIVPFNADIWPYDPVVTGSMFRDNFGPVTVPEDHYLAMGDNRDESLDGRYFGFVPHWAIKSVPTIRIYPPTKLRIVN
ncbi:signal peptidase I [Spirochaetota bacterium]